MVSFIRTFPTYFEKNGEKMIANYWVLRCVRASLFGWFGQLDGTASVVSGSDEVLIQYTVAANGVTWTQ